MDKNLKAIIISVSVLLLFVAACDFIMKHIEHKHEIEMEQLRIENN